MNKKNDRKKIINEIGFYTDLGLRYAIAIIAFLGLGYFIDIKTGLKPTFTLIGVFFGASAGFYSLYRSLISHVNRNEKKKL